MLSDTLRRLQGSGSKVEGEARQGRSAVREVLSDHLPGFLIISFCSLLVFPLLYIFRSHDNNTLTSWQWVFTGVPLSRMYLLVFMGIVLSAVMSMIPVSERAYPFFLIVLSSCAVYPAWTEPEVILDTARYIVQAKHMAVSGPLQFLQEWGNGIDAWTDMPLIPFLHGLIFRYAGEARIYIQMFSTFLFALTVVFTFLLGKELWDESTGFFAGLMLMTIPYLMTQVPLMLVDVPAMFFVVLAFFCTVRAIRYDGKLMVMLAPLTVFLAVMSKYSTWGMLLILPAILIAYRKNDLRKKAARLIIVISIALVLLVIAIGFKYKLFQAQIDLLSTYQLPALKGWSESWISTFFFQSHPFLALFAAGGIYISIKERDGRFLIAGWFLLFIMTFQVYRIRYIIPLFPLFALMGARGLRFFVPEQLRKYAVFSMISLSLIIVYAGYVPFLEKTSMSNLREAGDYLDAMKVPVAKVIPLPQDSSSGNTLMALPILDLYTDTKLVYNEMDAPVRSDNHELLPLLFTWKYTFGHLYAGSYQEPGALVLISSSFPVVPETLGTFFPSDALSSFSASEGVFRYKTFVQIFKP